jgi:hypothetical protein
MVRQPDRQTHATSVMPGGSLAEAKSGRFLGQAISPDADGKPSELCCCMQHYEFS